MDIYGYLAWISMDIWRISLVPMVPPGQEWEERAKKEPTFMYVMPLGPVASLVLGTEGTNVISHGGMEGFAFLDFSGSG